MALAAQGNSRRQELISFYQPLMGEQPAQELVDRCLALQTDLKPLRVLNCIERLTGLGDDIGHLRRARQPLTVFFLVICVESIYALGDRSPGAKSSILQDFLDKYLEAGDKQKLRHSIKRDCSCDIWHHKGENLGLDIIARLLSNLRNTFVHEGEFWGFHFADADNPHMLNLVSMKESTQEAEVEHYYSVTLTLEEFRAIMLRGCINFVKELLHRAR